MKDSPLKAFLVYAYAFVLIFMINSLLSVILLKMGVSYWISTVLHYVLTPILMYVAYAFSVERFLGKEFNRRKIPKAWLYQFVPFFFLSVVASWLLFSLVKKPSVAVFFLLNVEVVLIYFTFQYSLKKLFER